MPEREIRGGDSFTVRQQKLLAFNSAIAVGR